MKTSLIFFILILSTKLFSKGIDYIPLTGIKPGTQLICTLFNYPFYFELEFKKLKRVTYKSDKIFTVSGRTLDGIEINTSFITSWFPYKDNQSNYLTQGSFNELEAVFALHHSSVDVKVGEPFPLKMLTGLSGRLVNRSDLTIDGVYYSPHQKANCLLIF